MHLQRILIYCLSFVVFTNANNLKKDVKEPKVQSETIRLVQPKRSTINDNSFMPVFLTTSNVKASDFTQEMLKSLASNNYIKPSVKLSTNRLTTNKQSNRSATSNKENKKLEKTIKSETVITRWSKAGTSSNFSPTLPINLTKMHFDTTGFKPIIQKQSTRSSSNPKLIKQASKPAARPLVNSRTVPFIKLSQQTPVGAINTQQAKRKTLISLDNNKSISSRSKEILPNPSVRVLKPIKPNSKLTTSKQVSTAKSSIINIPKVTTSKLTTTNAKIVDNRPIAAASSTELSSYLTSQLNSRDARKALLKMNTLRYLAKLSPQWSASSLSETYQSGGSLKAYPIGKITLPEDQGSYGGESGYKKKPEISIELIKEILRKLTNDEVQFNKLYVMGTHRPKGQDTMNNDHKQYNDQPTNSDAYNQENAEYQQDGGSYQDQNSNGYEQNQGDYNQQDQKGYNQQENGYNQPDNGGYSQPDYSQGGNYENGGNSYDSGAYPNSGDSYSNDKGGNSYQNEGGEIAYNSNNNGDNSYNSNEGSSYNTPDNGNSYQNGGTDEEQGYHLQSLDMSEYTNRAYVPAYSLNSLASFVHNVSKIFDDLY